MNIKKLLVTGAAAGLLLVSAAGAFANGDSSGLSIKNEAEVLNNVNTFANTGYNNLTVKGSGEIEGSWITTGNAGALSDVSNVVNSNGLYCGCFFNSGEEDHQSNGLKIENEAGVLNNVNTFANTGYNSLTVGSWHHHSHHGGSSEIEDSGVTTGDAGAASWVANVVNTNVFGTP